LKGNGDFMSDKPRKKNKGEINKNLHAEPRDIVQNLNVDPRKSRHVEEKNRYEKMVDAHKEEKYLRDEEKLKKPHIGNKGHVEKLVKAEAEQDFLDGDTERSLKEKDLEEAEDKKSEEAEDSELEKEDQ
jgi:hypothetical protein